MQNKFIVVLLASIFFSGCSSIQWREGSLLSDKSKTNKSTQERPVQPNSNQVAEQNLNQAAEQNSNQVAEQNSNQAAEQNSNQVAEQNSNQPQMNNQTDTAAENKEETPLEIQVATQRQLTSPPYPSKGKTAESLRIEQQLNQITNTLGDKPMEASTALSKLSQYYPNSSGIHYHLGRIAFLENKPLEAITSLETALDIAPNNFYAANLLGLVYRSIGDFKQAQNAYKKSIQIWPDYSTAWYNLGILEDLYKNNIKNALIAYQNYLAIETSKLQTSKLLPQEQKSNTMQQVELWVKDLSLRIERNTL